MTETSKKFLPVLLSRRETAELLGVDMTTLASWAHYKNVTLPFIKVGIKCMYSEDDVYNFINTKTERLDPVIPSILGNLTMETILERLKEFPTPLLNRRETTQALGITTSVMNTLSFNRKTDLPYITIKGRCMYSKESICNFVRKEIAK